MPARSTERSQPSSTGTADEADAEGIVRHCIHHIFERGQVFSARCPRIAAQAHSRGRNNGQTSQSRQIDVNLVLGIVASIVTQVRFVEGYLAPAGDISLGRSLGKDRCDLIEIERRYWVATLTHAAGGNFPGG